MGAWQLNLHLFIEKNGEGAGKIHIFLAARSCFKSSQFKNTFGAKIKIMWEEQLVDPPIDNITSVNVRESSVLN